MKTGLWQKSTWLGLCLVSVGLLLSLIYFQMSYVYPQVKRYFDKGSSPTSQPLASRARSYLLKSLALYTEADNRLEARTAIRHNLDMAYGLLNVDLYLRQYACTASSLLDIDTLTITLERQSPVELDSFSQMMLPVLQCTDLIEEGQDNKRSALAIEMADKLDFHQQLLFWGSMLMGSIAFGFWMLHLKQRQVIAAGRDETDRWIRHALRDGLTGALNRRAFDQDFNRLMNRFQENGNLFSLLLCDIDYFKQYNDSMGHIEGDRALQLVTDALGRELRDRDNLYRYGGEELVIILDNTNAAQASRVGRRALELVRELRLVHPKSATGYLTISIGCATVNETAENTKSLMSLADKRLYQAKQGGRDRLACSNGLSST